MEHKTYRHYKGGKYKVIGLGLHSETHEEVVIYQALEDSPDYPAGSIWVRPKKLFFDEVEINGVKKPRFSSTRD